MTGRIEAQQVTRERFYESEQKVATRLLPTEFADIRTTLKPGDMIRLYIYTRDGRSGWYEWHNCVVVNVTDGENVDFHYIDTGQDMVLGTCGMRQGVICTLYMDAKTIDEAIQTRRERQADTPSVQMSHSSYMKSDY